MQWSKNRQNYLEKYKVGGLLFSDFETYHKAQVIQTEWYWYKDIQINGRDHETELRAQK